MIGGLSRRAALLKPRAFEDAEAFPGCSEADSLQPPAASSALTHTVQLFLERRSLKKLTVFLPPPAGTSHTHVGL